MAEFKITTDEAVKKVRELITELKNLKKEGATFGNSSKESFNKAENGLEELNSTMVKLTESINTLKTATKKKSQALSEEEKLTKQLNTAKEQSLLLDSEEYKELIKLRKAKSDVNKEIRDSGKLSKEAANEQEGATKKQTAETKKQVNAVAALNANLNKGREATKKAFEVNEIKKFKAEVAALEKKEKEELETKRKSNYLSKESIKARLKEADSINSNKNALDKQRQAALKANAVAEKSNKTKKKSVSLTKQLTVNLWTMVKAYGVLQATMLFTKAIKSAFELTKTFDSLNFSMEKTVGTGEKIKKTNTFLLRLAKDYGAEIITLTNRYVKFFVAAEQSGVALRDTNKIFETFTKVSGVMGLKADELNGVFLALEQMLSKGKITTEELRRQLGERLPGAMGIMAVSMGVSIEQLDKMMKKGEVLSSEVLPNFAEAVEMAYGIDTVEKVKTLTASQNRLTTAWQNFVKTLTEGDSTIKKALESTMGFLEYAMNKITGSIATQDQKLEQKAAERYSKDLKQFNKYVSERMSKEKGYEESLKKLRDDFNKKNKEAEEAEGTALGLIKQKEASDAFEKIKDFKKKETEIAKEVSEELIKKEKQKNEGLKAEYEKYSKEVESLTKLGADSFITKSLADLGDDASEKLVDSFNTAKGMLKHFRVELASSNNLLSMMESAISTTTPKPKPTKDDNTEKAWRTRLAAAIKYSEETIKLDEETIEEQTLLALVNKNTRIEIAKSLYRDEVKLAEENKEKLRNALAKKNKSIVEADIKHKADLAKVEANRVKRAKEALDKELESANIKYINAQKLEQQRWDALTQAQRDEQSNTDEHLRILLEAELEHAKEVLRIKLASGQITKQQHAEMLANISKLEGSLKKLGDGLESSTAFTDWIKANQEGLELLADTMTALSDLSAAFSDRKLAQIEREQEALEKAHERDLERLDEATERSLEAVAISDLSEQEKADRAEGINESKAAQEKRLSKEKEKRDAESERKKAKIRKRQAVIDKAAALSQITISTALALGKAKASTAGLPFPANILAFFETKAGILTNAAIQTAAVLAAPIPAFAEGGENKKNQKILINDHKSGRQEYINRGGEILTTTKKNAVVDGKKGDFIYKDYQTMMHDLGYGMMHDNAKKTLTGGANIFNPSSLIPMQDNSNLESSINKGIKNGFGGINHTTIINIPKGADEYLNKRGY